MVQRTSPPVGVWTIDDASRPAKVAWGHRGHLGATDVAPILASRHKSRVHPIGQRGVKAFFLVSLTNQMAAKPVVSTVYAHV